MRVSWHSCKVTNSYNAECSK